MGSQVRIACVQQYNRINIGFGEAWRKKLVRLQHEDSELVLEIYCRLNMKLPGTGHFHSLYRTRFGSTNVCVRQLT